MNERRIEPRLLCADTVDIRWEDSESGRTRRMTANLDDISRFGACLLLDWPLPPKTRLRIAHPHGELTGHVTYCVLKEIGYVTGVELDPGCVWSQEDYRPEHLYDPRQLGNPVAKETVVRTVAPHAEVPITGKVTSRAHPRQHRCTTGTTFFWSKIGNPSD
jgi:hypothetical protein